MRLLLFSGGGGAGVTTLAAASAVLCAERGARTRLLAAEPDALAIALPPDAPLPGGLTIPPVDPLRLLGADAPAVTGWLRALLRWGGFDQSLADDVAALPGAGALAALLAAADDSASADLTVVDLGPLLVALPLLHLLCTDPTGERSDEPRGVLARVAGGLVATLADLPKPDDEVRATGERAAARLASLRQTLRSPDRCSVRMVVPDDARAARLVREAETVCGLHGIGLDAVVTRAAYPPAGSTVWLHAPWHATVPVGHQQLCHYASTVYGDADPMVVLSPARVPTFHERQAGVDLVLPLPPRPPHQFRVRRRRERIEVTAGGWRRAFPVPERFVEWHGRRAWHDGTNFRVRLEA